MDPAHPRTLVGVGVGPGDPELVTLKAVRVLDAADAILVPQTEASSDGPGRAERIVHAVCQHPRLTRIPFSMADRSGVTARRRQAWDDSAAAALAAFAAGATTVAFATVGDPSVYSTFSYLAATVTAQLPDVNVQVVPGITAMQAIAAASLTPLVEGTETLTLVPVTGGAETIAAALDQADTVVAYKGGRQLPELAALIAAHRPGVAPVVGVDLTLESQRLLDPADFDHAAPYFTTVLVPATRRSTGGRL